MTARLERRVERLEGGTGSDEVLVCGYYPAGVTLPRCRALAEAKAREFGYKPPLRIEMYESGRPGGEADIEFWFIGTGAELDALIQSVTRDNRRDTGRG